MIWQRKFNIQRKRQEDICSNLFLAFQLWTVAWGYQKTSNTRLSVKPSSPNPNFHNFSQVFQEFPCWTLNLFHVLGVSRALDTALFTIHAPKITKK